MAVEDAFVRVWPGPWIVTGFRVDSGVSDQPLNEDETVRGAWNRARAALAASDVDFGVGLEGGIVNTNMECRWIVVIGRDGRTGVASTGRIMLPPMFAEAMRDGATLDELCARQLGVEDAGKAAGYFGLVTNGAVPRPAAYRDAVAFALAPFVHPVLFESA
jgi:inosine/xanthosine triphosphatase